MSYRSRQGSDQVTGQTSRKASRQATRRPQRRENVKLGPPPMWRAYAVLVAFGVFAVVLCARAFELQVLDHEFLASEGDKRHLRTVSVPAGRGAIRDRNGEPLALSAPTESVWTVPGALLEAPQLIPPLAKQLGMTASELRQRLNKYSGRQFLYLRRQLSPSQARNVMQLDAPGVFLQREYKRYYPAGEAAAQLVGLTNIDGRGQEGMELSLDENLHGESGSRRVIKDRVGRVAEDLAEFSAPRAGEDIRLSIDLRLQYLAYRELKSAVVQNRAKAGVVVMLDPANGEVLALASYPSFNPNNRESITKAGLRHRAVTDLFEPGSTMKPLLLARAMDAGLYTRDSIIDTEGGVMRVGRELTVRDFRDYGDVDFQRLLTKSSNVGAAKVGLKLGPERVWQVYQDFGFGQATGSRFPGERAGVLRDYFRWGDVETATASYGYGASVTAMQLARAHAVLADDGRLHDLRLVMGDLGGAVLAPQQVVSAKTAGTIRELLQGVITPEGTGTRAAIRGYRVAGKSGTVRKVGAGGYNDKRHQALFVGMAPADHPRVVTLVMVDEPTADAYYGGAVSAPVFSNVMHEAMRILRVPPDDPATFTADAGAKPGDRS